MDPIVRAMVEDAEAKLARGEMIAHRRFDPEIVAEMIEEEKRNGIERRQHRRGAADRRSEAG